MSVDLVEPPPDDRDVVAPGGDHLGPPGHHLVHDGLVLPPPVAGHRLPDVRHGVALGLRSAHLPKDIVYTDIKL